ncbi:hypothetical protein NMG60_11013267 [Bertholletia excelsa]
MSPILTSQGAVLATAMAVSGTVLLLVLRLQKSLPATEFPPKPCISSDGKRRGKKKKRVHFAEDVVDPTGNGEEFRRQHRSVCTSSSPEPQRKELRGMPANRVALYNGILRDRLVHRRLAYSY